MEKLIILGLLSLLTACQPKIDDPEIFFVPVEICKVDTRLCVEYIFPSSLNQDLCDAEKNRYSGTSAVLSKSSSCPLTAIAGKCSRSSDKIYFYSSDFSSGYAQTECSTRSGTFEQ